MSRVKSLHVACSKNGFPFLFLDIDNIVFAAGGSSSSISSSGCSKKVENGRLHPLPSPSASTAAPLSKVKRADFESDSAFYDALAILFTLVKVLSSAIHETSSVSQPNVAWSTFFATGRLILMSGMCIRSKSEKTNI